MADPSSERLIFRGSDPEECEIFVSTVRRRALDQGKHRDNEWMAIYASSCLVGEAFYWYEEQEDSVQNDWSRLRPALVARFGRAAAPSRAIPGVSETVAAQPPPSTIPTPAAVPSNTATSGSLNQVGRLKFLNSNGGFRGYLGNNYDLWGIYRDIVPDSDTALSVSIPSKSFTGAFEIKIVGHNIGKSLGNSDELVIIWWALAGLGWERGALCTAFASSGSKAASKLAHLVPPERNVWTISEGGELHVEYPMPSPSSGSGFCLAPGERTLDLVG
ncbi:hypothetical protein M407DRAFT_23201 [Tulasnella calospora MUT 4182]|uniref:Uncharacterized protein n=1 Tax=Tulasnella calospora MUT 4182 TaxID=1051891 RepID=A0A0C3M1D0_9AGAM|nr:hypothetical protein M407DRAFT_23201 [Tulasnella calospora MUT 4182]